MLIFHIFNYINQKERFDNDGNYLYAYYEEYKYLILDIITAFIAVSLSIWCNKNEPFGAKLIYILFSMFFSHLYLLWFVFYRLLMGYYTVCGVRT